MPLAGGHFGDGLRDVVGLLDQQVRAEHGGQLAQRRQRSLLLLAIALAARTNPQQVELGAEPLGRAPGAPDDPLEPGSRLDQRQQPLADRLWRASAAIVSLA